MQIAVRSRNPKIPKAINDVVLKAMAPDIPSRYQRASEVLRPIVHGFVELFERNLLVRRGLGFSPVDRFIELCDSVKHLLRFTGIAA